MHNESAVEDGWRGFKELCRAAVGEGNLDALLELFLTLEEQEDLALRFQLIKALLEGKLPQREIAKDLQISISKITRGSNALKTIKPVFREFLQTRM
ncbi:MAG: trp operon repressor [Verrucomicrobia bacterium]|nr:trp operon repressor [Verrucomicrobiota bacterium]